MARRSSPRASAPSTRGRTRPVRRPWLSAATKNELRGILFALTGLATLLCLIDLPERGNLIGPAGALVAEMLTVAVGRPVAFSLPALLLWWGWLAFRGRRPQHSWIKYAGAAALVLSSCALIGLVKRDAGQEQCLAWSGAVGAFLVYDAPLPALNLPRCLGVAGTALLFTGLGLTGLLLATDVLYSDLAARLARRVAALARRLLFVWTAAKWLFASLGKVRRGRAGHEARPAGRPVMAPRPTSRVLNPLALAPAEERTRAKTAPVILDHDDPRAAVLDRGTPPPEPVAPPRPRPAPRVAEAVQEELDLSQPYELPPLSLLDPPVKTEHRMTHDQILEISRVLEQTLRDFGIEASVTQVTQGPVITRFELQPAAGVKIGRIVALTNDIAMALRAHAVRILAPIPGKGAVGIEVPNPKPNVVYFHDLASSDLYQSHPSPLAFVLGKTIAGETHVCDLAAMPHLLIAGATGSGKSVCLNAIIASILFRQKPDAVKFMMIDPKRVELSVYDAIPHLIAPVVTDSRKAASALAWMVEHMEERYRTLAEAGVRHIDAYNAAIRDDARRWSGTSDPRTGPRPHAQPMPHIVVIIDELADLMMVAKADVEENVQRIAQMARAVGIHLIIATQRPSVNVITGVIKSNLPSRIAFKVSQKVDSRVILDTNGAEALLGRGDMLFSSGGAAGPVRLQGAYIADAEIERLAEHIRAQERAVYLKTDFQEKRSKGKFDADEAFDEAPGQFGEATLSRRDLDYADDTFAEEPLDEDLFRQATRLVLQNRKASVSLIQRRMKIGFARAGRLMDMMEQAGIVGPYRGSKPREILVDPAEYLAQMDRDGVAAAGR